MHISTLRLRNFRNFRNAAFRFQKDVNTLIGENGSGKTNAFYALRLLLDDSLSRRATQLLETDFNRADGDWKGHWIIITVDFENLDLSEGCQILGQCCRKYAQEQFGDILSHVSSEQFGSTTTI